MIRDDYFWNPIFDRGADPTADPTKSRVRANLLAAARPPTTPAAASAPLQQTDGQNRKRLPLSLVLLEMAALPPFRFRNASACKYQALVVKVEAAIRISTLMAKLVCDYDDQSRLPHTWVFGQAWIQPKGVSLSFCSFSSSANNLKSSILISPST